MKFLPLFYYPSTWILVDDDQNLLSIMVDVFNKKNHVVSFQSPVACIEYLKKYTSQLTDYYFLEPNLKDENYDILQQMPLNFDIRSIVTLLDNNKRHQEITVMIIDYDMPEINGFELSKLTRDLLIPKILLTGNKHNNEAISCFNNGLINRFIEKTEDNMLDKLSNYLEELSHEYFQAKTAPLLAYLETDGKLPLSDPTFIDFFEDYCRTYKIREYYLIDKQGSFLCIDSNSNHSHLVFHTEKSLSSWLAIYGDEKELQPADLSALQQRKKIPFFGIKLEAFQVDAQEWSKHFYYPNILQGREMYYWARIEDKTNDAKSNLTHHS